MKKRLSKKDFSRFTKRSTHKRKERKRALEGIISEIEKTGVGLDHLTYVESVDGGRRERISSKIRRDEVRAEGIFQGSKSGFGFVAIEDSTERDIFIPEGRCGNAIDGDYVEVIFHRYTARDGENKTEGRVVRVIKVGRESIVGTLTEVKPYTRFGKRYKKSYTLIPDDAKVSVRPTVVDCGGAKDGDKVAVKLLRGRGTSYSPEAEVVAVFGEASSRSANYDAILFDSGIPTEFTPKELEEASRVAKFAFPEDRKRVTDTVFTIDGEGAKDLDDAVSLRRRGDGYRLGVHIADVSYYVEEKSPLERCVSSRGTSVYFTDKVVPMLPPVLSNGACSLNAGEDKLTLSAFIDLDKEGNILGVKIEKTVICSSVRGVYSEVNSIFEGRADSELKKKYKSVLPTLSRMRELYALLLKKSEKRGMLDMDVAEAAVLVDADSMPVDIVRVERGDAERMIEQFMLTANAAVATYLHEREIPCVYRVHEDPPADRLEEFLNFVHNLGFDATVVNREKVSPRDLKKLLDLAEEKGIRNIVSYSLLRSLAKAKYSDVRAPHFGLGIKCYCHFTSPIRRLSDLATHRIIHKVLFEGKKPRAYASYAKRMAVTATETQLRAMSAERRIENLYKVLYMQKFIGEEFSAFVSSVTQFGLFVELENTCEGLIPLSEMPGYFIYDERNVAIYNGKLSYRLGDTVKVRLEEADTVKGKLRFSLIL